MPFKIAAFGESHTGMVRQNNEDYFGKLPNLKFFVLADGMGGHLAGEVAAKESVTMLCRLFSKLLQEHEQKRISVAGFKTAIGALIEEVNRRIYQMGCEDARLRGMGTTLCCCYIHDDILIYGHVGDSRIYRYRHGKLEQLTRDHSLFRELVDMRELSEEDEEKFLYKNIITKAIGLSSHIEPAVQAIDLEKDDLILMCSDGLTDMLTAKDISKFMGHHLEDKSTVETTTKALIAAANKRGGHDNVTIVLIHAQGIETV